MLDDYARRDIARDRTGQVSRPTGTKGRDGVVVTVSLFVEKLRQKYRE